MISNKFKLAFLFCLTLSMVLFSACDQTQAEEKVQLEKCLEHLSFKCKTFREYQERLKANGKANKLAVCQQMLKENDENSPVTIEFLSPMNKPRTSEQQTIVLKDGRVLIIGGDIDDRISAEVFNPDTKSFELISGDITPYLNKNFKTDVYDIPIMLPDKKVYYYGSIFNPETNKFSSANSGSGKKLKEFNDQVSSKDWQVSTKFEKAKLLTDGKIIFKKLSENNTTKEDNFRAKIYEGLLLKDPFNKTPYLYCKLMKRRNNFVIVQLKQENLLIIGGQNKNDLSINSFEICNPNKGTTQLFKTSFTVEHYNYLAKTLLLPNGSLLISNESTDHLELYDSTTNQISDINYLKDLCKPDLFSLSENKVLFLNSFNYFDNVCRFNITSMLYDVPTNLFVELNNTCFLYPYQKLTQLPGGKILITGGSYCNNKSININNSNFAAILFLRQKE